MRDRDDVLAIAAHDLRNPLHALSLQLVLARSSAQSHGDAETLSRVEKAQAMLARYVERATLLLDLVRVSSGGYPLNPRDVDLSALVQSVAEGLTQEARFRQVSLEADTPEHVVAHTDPLVVEQIIDNLVLNALKHAACSKVTLTLGRSASGDEAWVSISDDGAGIAASDQATIFEKFRIAQNSPRGHGTGLGLWIVKQLSASLNGSVELESSLGRGSRFTLRFPLIVRKDP